MMVMLAYFFVPRQKMLLNLRHNYCDDDGDKSDVDGNDNDEWNLH